MYYLLIHPGLEALLACQARAAGPWPALGAEGVWPSPGQPLSFFQQDLAPCYLRATLCVCVSACLCVRGAGFAGTPGYLSPEVLRKDPYGKPVDLWACGESIQRPPCPPGCCTSGALSPFPSPRPHHCSPQGAEVSPGALRRGHPVHPASWVSPILGRGPAPAVPADQSRRL